MSKIGIKPITVPATVNVEITASRIRVKGAGGEINLIVPKSLKVIKKDATIIVSRINEEKKTKSLHGLYRQLIANAVAGMDNPWKKTLEIVGTGFNVKPQGEDLIFKIGYSHPVVVKKIPGIKFEVVGANKIIVSGADKQLVGQVAYQIKLIKKPDPYKGKGIRYEGEQLKLKPGKKAKTVGAGVAA